MKKFLYVCLALLACGGLFLYAKLAHPSMEPYTNLQAQSPTRADVVRAKFLGTSTIVFTDGTTTLMTDGYLTRPSLWSVARDPDEPEPTQDPRHPPRMARAAKNARVRMSASHGGGHKNRWQRRRALLI